jgi:uncharacterized protein (TIGR02118 family)
MIKVIGLMKRKPGLNLEEFSRYWYETHAPLGFRDLPRRITLQRYVHNYVAPLHEEQEYPFDGVAEFCFGDMKCYQEWLTWFMSDGGHALRQDGMNFMDYNTVKNVLCEEKVMIPPKKTGENRVSDLVKVIAMVKRKPGMTLQEFVEYWRDKHAPLALSILPKDIGVAGYIHNYAIPLEDGSETAFDGIGVLYFDDYDAFMKSNEWFYGKEGKVLIDDEENFVDTRTRIAAVVRERVIRPWSI